MQLSYTFFVSCGRHDLLKAETLLFNACLLSLHPNHINFERLLGESIIQITIHIMFYEFVHECIIMKTTRKIGQKQTNETKKIAVDGCCHLTHILCDSTQMIIYNIFIDFLLFPFHTSYN